MDGEMMEIPDTPFCNDFANPTDNVETCANENDCCASLKEEHIRLKVINIFLKSLKRCVKIGHGDRRECDGDNWSTWL